MQRKKSFADFLFSSNMFKPCTYGTYINDIKRIYISVPALRRPQRRRRPPVGQRRIWAPQSSRGGRFSREQQRLLSPGKTTFHCEEVSQCCPRTWIWSRDRFSFCTRSCNDGTGCNALIRAARHNNHRSAKNGWAATYWGGHLIGNDLVGKAIRGDEKSVVMKLHEDIWVLIHLHCFIFIVLFLEFEKI